MTAGAPRTAPRERSRWPVGRHVLLGATTIALVFGVGFGWGTLTTISGAVVTSGQIEVDQNRQVVQHADGGTVAEILVSDGQAVTAGEVLVRLDGSLLGSERTIVETQFFEILARRGRLEAEREGADSIVFPPELVAEASVRADVAALMDGQSRLFSAREETHATEIDQLGRRVVQGESLIAGIDVQHVALERQVRFLVEERQGQQELFDKGLAQSGRLLSLQREEARLEGLLGELAANRAQAESRITETEIEVLRLVATRREDANAQLRDIGFRELELAERRRALDERIARLEIRAPVSGIVLNMSVTTPRAVIRPAEPLLYLIPQDRPLVIATRVPTVHIDQVRPGQEVKVVFSAFNLRTTPEVAGRIVRVSADTLTDERTLLPYYRAEISLAPEELAKLGDQILLPGMPVEAFIRTDDRTPLSFLVKPLSDYFNRAFRES